MLQKERYNAVRTIGPFWHHVTPEVSSNVVKTAYCAGPIPGNTSYILNGRLTALVYPCMYIKDNISVNQVHFTAADVETLLQHNIITKEHNPVKQ